MQTNRTKRSATFYKYSARNKNKKFYPNYLSKEAIEVIDGLLQTDPSKRMETDAILGLDWFRTCSGREDNMNFAFWLINSHLEIGCDRVEIIIIKIMFGKFGLLEPYVSMHPIITYAPGYTLFLGDYKSALDKTTLKLNNIYTVLTVGSGMFIHYDSTIVHKVIQIQDSEEENIY